jgi:DNA polymerase-3 subunit epsilon
MDVYKAWDDVPDNLKTKTQLAKEGLRPTKDQKPAAIFESVYYEKEYPLYSVEEAIPKRKPTEAQLAALEKNRIKARTCQICEKVGDRPQKICWQCKQHLDHEVPVIEWAREVLNKNCVFLDTETTGLDYSDEIVEISIIDRQGKALIDTLIRPKCRWIPKEAKAIHGITNQMVANAPKWPEIHDTITQILQTAEVIVVYNADFDWRMLRQTREKYDLPKFGISSTKFHCAMEQFAEYYGEWNSYHHNWKWQRLGVAVNYFDINLEGAAHRALGDTIATLRVVEALAQNEIRSEKK